MTATKFTPVIENDGSSALLWIRPGEPIPTQLATLVRQQGLSAIVVSFGGGNNGLSDELKAGMPAYFSAAFKGFTGTAFSGGTGKFDEERNLTSFEITSVPALLMQENRCAGVGSTPLTTVPRLGYHHGNIKSDGYGAQIDPRHSANMIVATHPSDAVLGWNGDLKQRFAFFEELLELGYKVVIFIFNGGDVTTEEIYLAAELTKKGGELIVVDGSGREADKFVRVYRDGTVEDTNAKGQPLDQAVAAARAEIRKNAVAERISIVKVGDAEGTRALLIAKGVLPEPQA